MDAWKSVVAALTVLAGLIVGVASFQTGLDRGWKFARTPAPRVVASPLDAQTPETVPKTGDPEEARFDSLAVGEWPLVDLYSDHSGIRRMQVEAKVSADQIIVKDGSEMRMIKLNQILRELKPAEGN